MSLNLTLNAEGKTADDLLDALDVIRQQIESGMTSGFDRGDGRSYNFDVRGEEEYDDEEHSE